MFDEADALVRGTRGSEPGGTAENAVTAPGATQVVATRTSWKLAVDCDYEVYHLKFADDLTAATTLSRTSWPRPTAPC